MSQLKTETENFIALYKENPEGALQWVKDNEDQFATFFTTREEIISFCQEVYTKANALVDDGLEPTKIKNFRATLFPIWTILLNKSATRLANLFETEEQFIALSVINPQFSEALYKIKHPEETEASQASASELIRLRQTMPNVVLQRPFTMPAESHDSYFDSSSDEEEGHRDKAMPLMPESSPPRYQPTIRQFGANDRNFLDAQVRLVSKGSYKPTNNHFFLKFLAGFVLGAGIGLVVTGILLVQPELIVAGAVATVCGAISIWGLFRTKPGSDNHVPPFSYGSNTPSFYHS